MICEYLRFLVLDLGELLFLVRVFTDTRRADFIPVLRKGFWAKGTSSIIASNMSDIPIVARLVLDLDVLDLGVLMAAK